MKVTISARGNVPKATKLYAEEKVAKLEKYYGRLQKVEVIMKVEGERHKVEVILSVDHGTNLVAEQESGDLRSSIDLVLDKLERQLTKLKEKSRSHRIRVKKPELEPENLPEEEEETYEDIITKDLRGK